MAMNAGKQFAVVALVAAALLAAGVAQAQTRSDWIGPVGVEADWDEGDLGAGEGVNWLSNDLENFQPDRLFAGGEYGSISNGGVALVDHTISVSPTDIRLAEDAGSTGTLVIRNGGAINVQAGTNGTGTLSNGFAGGGAGTLVLRDNIGTVTLQNYAQTTASTLVTQLGSGTSFTSPVQVSTQITLAGTLFVEQTPGSGFTASTGDSWTLFQGAPVAGSFDSVQRDPALVTNPGQVLAVSTAGNAVTLSVDQRLVLQVDRFTGATTLRNPSGHSTDIELINYTLSSSVTPLDSSDARWLSFEDDAGKPGWFEANPTAANLSELNPAGSLIMHSGDSHDFGTPFTADTNAPLGTSRVDVGNASFQYQLPGGQYLDAAIETVGRFNDLVLVVDPNDGSTILQNQSEQTIELISYTISSDSDSLLTGWSGLEGLSEPGWFKANPTISNLSELAAGDSLVLSVGEQRDLGLAWNTSGVQDLTFDYQAITGELIPGTVHFGEPETIVVGLVGDYNDDGFVDAADYTVWRDNLGGPGSALAHRDPNNTGPVSSADYDSWKVHFGESSSPGSGTVALAAVPEPSAALLLVVGMVLITVGRSRTRS